MIICNREEGNKLIDQESNLFRSDDRNKFLKEEILDYDISLIDHGRGKGKLNIDEERRKEIATLALTSGLSIEDVAELTGVSQSSVSAYKKGSTSTDSYHEPDEDLSKHVNSVKNEISQAAQNKLLLAIEAITGEKIHSSKARDIAGIAKDMSAVIKNMTPDGPMIQNTRVLVYQPRIKEEDDFITVVANEEA